MSNEIFQNLKRMTFSDRYMAPEVYRRESYGKSIDVFSFALIVHEVQLNEN